MPRVDAHVKNHLSINIQSILLAHRLPVHGGILVLACTIPALVLVEEDLNLVWYVRYVLAV